MMGMFMFMPRFGSSVTGNTYSYSHLVLVNIQTTVLIDVLQFIVLTLPAAFCTSVLALP